MVINQTYEMFVLERSNTKAREKLVILQKLRDPRILLRLVGVCQIMESYCEVN
jgi:hypothetical protein